MLQWRMLVVAVICSMGCNSEGDVLAPEPQVAGVVSELGNEDVNEFRVRRTQAKHAQRAQV